MPSHRLPGIVFSAEPPPPADVLPRMDVAAFVGLASSGPLDVPVAVEALDRFRDVFGDDPQLAWDEDRGAFENAFLGSSVAAFFRNGGRRCWVVRAADRLRIRRHEFRLPGLSLRPRLGAADELRGADARARAAGGWCESLRVGTVLERRLLPLRQNGDAPFVAAAGSYRIDTAEPPGAVEPGELLELAFGDGAPLLFVFVAATEVLPEGLRIEAVPGRWLLPALSSPPEEADESSTADGVWMPVSETEGLDAWDALASASPPTGSLPSEPAVRRVRFELLAWRREALAARISDLGFHPEHPRFWGYLPTDEDLFQLAAGRTVPIRPPSVETLRAEASEPRFPFAGPEDPSEAAWYLPIQELGGDGGSGLFVLMASRLDVFRTRGPSDLSGSRLQRDGLETFGSGLFLDEDLLRIGSGALLGAAEHKRYLRGETLEGLYALLPVAEATLVAVPDAVHRTWSPGAPPLPEILGPPEIESVVETVIETVVESAIETSSGSSLSLDVRWTEPAGARDYRLEISGTADFAVAETAYEGPAREALVPVAGCPEARFLRVRARRGGEISPWSSTVFRIAPRPDFLPCGALPLVATHLQRTPLPGGRDRLTWDVVPGAESYRVEAAEEPGFVTPRTIHEGPGTLLDLPVQLDGIGYLRVAAVRTTANGVVEVGPRSNTIVRRPAGRSRQVLEPAGDTAAHLLDVQRALLRFCAARGDLLALLSLPRHFRQDETRRHLASLAPLSRPTTGPPVAFRAVPPLTQGEETVLSYGALYHPWLAAVEEGDFSVAPGFTPPEGAVAGTAADLSVERGAWWAPANLPLAGTVALDPEIDMGAWRRLAEIGVNVVRREPRGFLAQGADTLSRTVELRPISVRRLMILIRRLALREGGRYVFEPHDADFRSLVQHRFERFLSGLHVRGAFAGRTAADAFQVITDASVNPPRSVDAGRFIVELRVAPSRPLDFLTVRLVQTGPEQLSLQEI